ncbi:hypothetical protein EVAR_75956_1 [Eumeta japonica]|uniref:Uncharacterized protein n=1 Tax=Eumeta variegata TaxID=151549 RepID=A0A4C1UXR3_EUMVA|nr:hypothetical protein EVAR_75956_1 [Eumeta japonica]
MSCNEIHPPDPARPTAVGGGRTRRSRDKHEIFKNISANPPTLPGERGKTEIGTGIEVRNGTKSRFQKQVKKLVRTEAESQDRVLSAERDFRRLGRRAPRPAGADEIDNFGTDLNKRAFTFRVQHRYLRVSIRSPEIWNKLDPRKAFYDANDEYS